MPTDGAEANYVKEVVKALIDELVKEGVTTAPKGTNLKSAVDLK